MTTAALEQNATPMFSLAQRTEIEALIGELSKIRLDMVNRAERSLQSATLFCPSYQESARNLVHYLSFRSHDHRPLQKRLAQLGLSSLGRAESHVLASVDAVLNILHQLLERSWRPVVDEPTSLDFTAGPRLLNEHTEALLGPSPLQRGTRIMVTMPSEAAVDYRLVFDLLRHGMDCMRINCAHDDVTAWTGMVNNLRRAEKAVGRSCRILMDLGGPKLRTGPIESTLSVLKWRPQRDEFGRVIAPARIWFVAQEHPVSPPSAADAILPVPDDWLVRLKVGDLVTFTDARGAGRSLVIVQMTSQGGWGETRQTAYVTPSTVFYHRAVSEPRLDESEGVTVGEFRQHEQAIFLRQGDLLLLTKGTAPGVIAIVDGAGKVQTPARVSCTLPEVLNDVRVGERVSVD
jgi:pyruvate kinase